MTVRSIVVALLLCACAADPKPVVEEPEPEVERIDRGPSSYETGVGGLNHEAVEQAFGELQRDVIDCLNDGLSRVEAIGGSFRLALRIRPDGSLKWAYLPESTIGDRESELCILEAAHARSWPKPKSGEGLADHVFTADAAKPVHEVRGSRMRPAMRMIRRKVWRCVKGVRGYFTATMYLRRNGKVASVGVAPPNADADAKADCVAEALRKMRFGKQRRNMTKVTFAIR